MKNYINSQGFVSVGDTTNTLYIQENVQVTGSFSITGSINVNGTTVKAIKGPSITVGNALRGDTINDCDYLDAGDGVQLQAALTAAGARVCDVFVREGVYTLATPLTVPTLVTVEFAAGFGTALRNTATSRSVISFGDSAKARNLYIELATAPTLGATGTRLITIASEVQLDNLYIFRTYSNLVGNLTNESLRWAISGSECFGAQINHAIIYGMSFEQVGITTTSFTAIGAESANTNNGIKIIGSTINTADNGIALIGPGLVDGFGMRGIHYNGFVLGAKAGTQNAQVIANGNVILQPAFTTLPAYGATVDTGTATGGPFGTKISNVSFTKVGTLNTGSVGIRAIGTGSGTQISFCSFDTIPTAITASATQTNMVVIGNVAKTFTNGYLVQSSGSVVANNILI